MLYIDTISTINTWEIPLTKYDVWKSPKCKSIYVFEEDKDEVVKTYRFRK